MNSSVTNPNRQYALNIPKYFVYTAFKGFGFGLFTAIWLIYLQQQRGFSLSQATIIDVVFWVAMAVGEIPTGIVADLFGRKTSLMIGAAMAGISVILWALAPTVPLIMIAYAFMALGITFLSGAEDALLYESMQLAGRSESYTRFVGRTSAVLFGATALGNVMSGLLGSVNLLLPFIGAGISLLLTFGVAMTFKESRVHRHTEGAPRKSYRMIVGDALMTMRSRPRLRYSVLFLTLIPLASLLMETFFVQPQSLALGVPIVGIGLVVMAIQITNMAGATFSDRIKTWLGESRVFYGAPLLIVVSLLLLATLQILPALVFIAVISLAAAVLHPILLTRIQNEVPDENRATLLSVQSLMFTVLFSASEPVLGLVADHSGLPATYVVLASILGVLSILLLWKSRCHLAPITAQPDTACEGAVAAAVA